MSEEQYQEPSTPQVPEQGGDMSVEHASGTSMGIPSEAPLSMMDEAPEQVPAPAPAEAPSITGERDEIILPGDGRMPEIEYTKTQGSPVDISKPLSTENKPEQLVSPEREAEIRERANLAAKIAKEAMIGASSNSSIDRLASAIYMDLGNTSQD